MRGSYRYHDKSDNRRVGGVTSERRFMIYDLRKQMTIKKITAFILPLCFFSFFAFPVFATKVQMDQITPGITSIPQFLKSVLDICVKIGIPVSAFFLIWSGFLFLSAQGDPGKLTTARRAFTYAVIGTAVILCAWLLAMAIQNTIWQEIGGNQAPTSQ